MTTTLHDIKRRAEAIPAAIDETLEQPLPSLSEALLTCSGFDVFGLGASAGPAAMTSEALNDLGLPSLVRSPSSFMTAPPRQRDGRGLIVFSQGLSPNARLAVERAPEYAASLLFTAISDSSTGERKQALDRTRELGMEVWRHDPATEPGSLLRLLGPTCATIAGLRFVATIATNSGRRPPPYLAHLGRLGRLLSKVDSRPLPDLSPHEDPLAWLVIGESTNIFHPLAWKWQEALYTPLGPTLDLLSFAHGPLQSLLRHAGSLMVLHRDTARDQKLLARLAQVLDPQRHRIVPLVAEVPGPARLFEDEAVVHRLLLAAMEARGITPGDWPGRGQDGPLYDLGK